MRKVKEKTIERHLTWEPDFANEIDIEEGWFTITLKKDEVEICCDWDYGWGGSGAEYMTISLQELKNLIEELEKS